MNCDLWTSLIEKLRCIALSHSRVLILPSQQYFELRSRQIQKLKETQNPNPYPHKFDVSLSIPHYIERYGSEGQIKAGEKLESKIEALAGRIHNIRAAGQNLRFYDLHGEGKKVQIMATKQ